MNDAAQADWPRVYIAGPYTDGDVALNVRHALETANALVRLKCTPYCPHLSHFWHIVTPRPWQYWLDIDLAWLAACDALVRLAGASQGANLEWAQAARLGLPSFLLQEGQLNADFIAWRDAWAYGAAAARTTE